MRSQKVKHNLATNNNNSSNKSVYTNIYCSIIHNSQKVEKPLKSINREMDKETTIQPYNGILFSHRKVQSTDKTWINLENITVGETGQTRSLT